MKKHIVMVCGYAQAGKDTFANGLVACLIDRGQMVSRFKFANSLRIALQRAFKTLGLDIDVWTEEPTLKELLRPVMVAFGIRCRAEDEAVFARSTLVSVEETLNGPINVAIITDLRYANEYELARVLARRNGWQLHRVVVAKTGSGPANAEEADSMGKLMLHGDGDFVVEASQGDTESILHRAMAFDHTHLKSD